MDNNKDTQLIEAYLNNQMSAAERQDFEKRLEQSEEFSAEFEKHQVAHKALDFLVAKSLKAQLEELEAKESEASNEQEEARVIPMKGRGRRLLMLRTAAAALVIVAIGLFYFYGPSSPMSGSELALAYYESPDYGTRGNDTDLQSNLDKGVEAIENKDFSLAISLLDSISSDNGLYAQAQYFIGHAHYQNGQYSLAEQSFLNASKANDLRIEEDAEWYALLSCLAQDKTCTEQINLLLNDSNHPYHQQVQKIKDQIK